VYLKVKRENKVLRRSERKFKLFLNDDQLASMKRKSAKGLKWSPETARKALQMRFSCGSTGYDVVTDSGYPLPSARTLRRRLQAINFSPGVLISSSNIWN
jgi:hypothetical protein